jgi:hypothetical protein
MPKKSDEEAKTRKVCVQCGTIHELPLSPDESRSDDWKMIMLSIVGIGMIVLIWVWVFKWGVPLVKHLSQ